MEKRDQDTIHDSLVSPSSKRSVYGSFAVVTFLSVVGGVFLYSLYFSSSREWALNNEEVQLIVESTREGRYQEAVAEYEELTSSSALTPNQSALAASNVQSSLIKAGDTEKVFENIRNMKILIDDPGITAKNKADLIRVLANAFNESGGNSAVFDEVYSGEPYSSFRVEGNANSMRNMLEWSYSTYPTSRAGISIAASYAKNALYVYSESSTKDAAWRKEVDRLVAKTEQYLRESDSLLEQELKNGERLKSNLSYAGYRYWRSFVFPTLAFLKGGSYRNDYQSQYDATIAFYTNEGSVEARQYLSFVYWMYANFLVLIDHDEDAARKQLTHLISFVKSDPQYEVNEFVVFVRNHRLKDPQEEVVFNVEAFERLSEISPEFKAFLEML